MDKFMIDLEKLQKQVLHFESEYRNLGTGREISETKIKIREDLLRKRQAELGEQQRNLNAKKDQVNSEMKLSKSRNDIIASELILRRSLLENGKPISEIQDEINKRRTDLRKEETQLAEKRATVNKEVADKEKKLTGEFKDFISETLAEIKTRTAAIEKEIKNLSIEELEGERGELLGENYKNLFAFENAVKSIKPERKRRRQSLTTDKIIDTLKNIRHQIDEINLPLKNEEIENRRAARRQMIKDAMQRVNSERQRRERMESFAARFGTTEKLRDVVENENERKEETADMVGETPEVVTKSAGEDKEYDDFLKQYLNQYVHEDEPIASYYEDLAHQEAEEKARKEAERKEAERKEAERKEAERKEAERKEAERKEAERKEAERKEAERKEAERKEAERKAAERKEAERKEAERKEAERKAAEEKARKEKEEAERKAAEEEARKEAEKIETTETADEIARQRKEELVAKLAGNKSPGLFEILAGSSKKAAEAARRVESGEEYDGDEEVGLGYTAKKEKKIDLKDILGKLAKPFIAFLAVLGIRATVNNTNILPAPDNKTNVVKESTLNKDEIETLAKNNKETSHQKMVEALREYTTTEEKTKGKPSIDRAQIKKMVDNAIEDIDKETGNNQENYDRIEQLAEAAIENAKEEENKGTDFLDRG